MEALETFEEQDFHGRIWIKDGTLWPGDVMDIRNRLGWLTAPTIMREHAEDLKAFADEIRRVQFTHILMTAGDQRAASIADGLWGHVTQARPGDYLAIQAYLTPQPETRIRLQEIRMLLRDRLHLATTVAYGPRYLHSTGQLHKGGPATGVFLQITGDDPEDLAIPGAGYGFSTLKAAQALGDLQALSEARRRIVRLHLKGKQPAGPDKLAQLVRALVKQV